MLDSIRYFLSDLAHWLRMHPAIATLVVVAVLGGGAAAYLLTRSDSSQPTSAAAPEVIVQRVPGAEATADLGFPEFATKNTTRVAGATPAAVAAAVALAVFPSTDDSSRPAAVTLVDGSDWATATAAASLMAAPVGAPVLLTDSAELGELTESALDALGPRGSTDTGGRQVFAIGDAPQPNGYRSLAVEGGDPAELAAAVDRLRTRMAGEPEHILVVSSQVPAYSMPAAGWAARSGDPVLLTGKDEVPEATIEALRSHDGVPVYVLGPESVIDPQTMSRIEHVAPGAQRIGEEGPVDNAIAFARYSDGGFGWDINDPGHGFVIASVNRPADAAAASALSASGTWGPLLVTDDGSRLPAPLHSYLLDLEPGYEDNPTRALYNHVWLIGDVDALSVELQAEVDELAEVVPVTSGRGPGVDAEPESQPNQTKPDSSGR